MSHIFSDMNFRNHILRLPAFRFALCFLLYPVLSPTLSWAATDWPDDIPYFVPITELPEARDFLLNTNIDLAKQASVDGFRLDTFKHIETGLWLEHRRRTRAELGKDFFLLAEYCGGTASSLDPCF